MIGDQGVGVWVAGVDPAPPVGGESAREVGHGAREVPPLSGGELLFMRWSAERRARRWLPEDAPVSVAVAAIEAAAASVDDRGVADAVWSVGGLSAVRAVASDVDTAARLRAVARWLRAELVDEVPPGG